MNHRCKHGYHSSEECKCLDNDQRLFFDCDDCQRQEDENEN